ncbi:MAG: bifunctional shikimate kinase/3-dehydroquinate synthase [Gaiellaceae bacterium]
MVGALERHLVLVGFMGAGKTTVGREVARMTQRPFVDLDEEIERRHGPVAELFAGGESDFRRVEEQLAAEALAAPEPSVIALGGGAPTSQATRQRLDGAFTVWLPVDADEAWRRVGGSDRPLAADEHSFRRLFDQRLETYEQVADASARGVDDVLRIALGVDVERGALPIRVSGPSAVIADERVLELHDAPLDAVVHAVPAEKTIAVAEELWASLRLPRDGTIVAFGGGSTTDLAGFVAATYLRGVPWVAVPTTLTGQVDAAVGGKTGIDLGGKNLVGAFHFPKRVVIDPDLLATLPEEERRAGLAEVVKTGLLAGREVWTLEETQMIAACAAYKASVVLADPYEHGRRAVLNLGHTFGHALEAASDYSLRHGDAVALGLLAALRLSGLPADPVEELLGPQPARVDRERAWAALQRDKKRRDGELRVVLLESPGEPKVTTLPEADLRRALDSLIAG